MQAAIGRIKERIQADLRRIAIREGGRPIHVQKSFGVVVEENAVAPPYGHTA